MPLPKSSQPPPRIQIERPGPLVDAGRYPVKRVRGDTVRVGATIFRDGHEALRAVVRHRPPGARRAHEHPMRHVDAHVDGDTWTADFAVKDLGLHSVTIEAWIEPFDSWREEVRRKLDAGQPELRSELSEGAVLLRDALARTKPATDRRRLEGALAALEDETLAQGVRAAAALQPAVLEVVERFSAREEATELDEPFPLKVDRERTRFGAWYELFPRSWGGLRGVTDQLPRLAELGFDVVYLPPIHPIGQSNRKGRNNALVAQPGDPGSPWAIGDASGGHDAVHPDLGTLEDVDRLTARAAELDMDVALDFAIQCSADHPWLTEHPQWFHRRPDGTLKYAENPPKKYQDIYNVNWQSEDWKALWNELRRIVAHWVDHGVKVFRVDNPHTKPLPFWEWLIAEVHAKHPEVIFLAEAFTRQAMMHTLAKVGFDQSYTYFTWKNGRHELGEYVNLLAHSEMAEVYRPNFFANTPDILHAYLQEGGPPAFAIRLVLAATLSPSYGIYSGFERFENIPARPGSEEYLDSEKYQVRQRTLDGPLLPLVRALNQARRAHPALHHLSNVTFLDTQTDGLIAFHKR
ncbi:MAG: alpha-1,4-glucan--maltose-1-phosphate maltosyltransferase, partial [Actinomycetota bacterium]|nr:alpha-1,4-glucan--maltose-1-phosphate maltosyltransferase [Actinomycetota bacterium]